MWLNLHKIFACQHTISCFVPWKNILKIINAFYLKDFTDINYSLVSLYRSYICEYSDEIILKNIDNLIGAEEFKEVIEKLKYLSLYYKKHSLKELMLELYKTFYSVAKNQNITKASKELNISQPAISKAISLADMLSAYSFIDPSFNVTFISLSLIDYFVGTL